MSETKKKFSLQDLKGTKQAAVAVQAKEIENRGGGNKQEYIQLEDGTTSKVRVFPAHPDTDPDNLFAQKREVSWLPFKKDNGELGRRPVLNAVTHGGQAKDIVVCYLKAAPEFIKSDRKLDSKGKAKKIDALTDFKTGIAPKGSYVMYAKKEEKEKTLRGLLEVTYGVKRKMDALSTSELEEDPEALDPIADPMNGSALKITYDSKKDNNSKYTVVLDRKSSELTEEDVEWLNEQRPLTEQLVGVYHKGHFDKAMAGLELYDAEHGIGLFKDEDFQDLASSLRDQLPEAPERDSDEDEPKGGKGGKRQRLEDMDRNELKQFIMDNDLDIRVTRKMDEEDILEAIEEELGQLPEYADEVGKKSAKKEEPFEEDEDDEDEEEEKPRKRKADKSEKPKPKPAAKKKQEVEEEDEDEDEDDEDEDDSPRARRSRRRGK